MNLITRILRLVDELRGDISYAFRLLRRGEPNRSDGRAAG
jgi:hypothetical protein